MHLGRRIVSAVVGGVAMLAGCGSDNSSATLSADLSAEARRDPKSIVAAQQPQNLFAQYPLDGMADDIGGRNLHGEVAGALPTQDRFGNAGGALQFDGVDDYVIVNSLEGFPEGNVPKSVCGWFKSSSDVSTYLTMLFGLGLPEHGRNFQIGTGPNYETGTTEFRVNGWDDGMDWRTGIQDKRYYDGQWHHCAVTYDGTTTRVFFDGVQCAATAAFEFLTPQNPTAVFGREIDLAEWEFSGALDDISIFTSAHSADAVQSMYTGKTDGCDQRKKWNRSKHRKGHWLWHRPR